MLNLGSFNNFYNILGCDSSVQDGYLKITINGPATLNQSYSNFVTTISSNTIHYSIPNLSNLTLSNLINLSLITDSTAALGDIICLEFEVGPITNDFNIQNNTYYQCYNVMNSYDPNHKRVSPQLVEPGYNNWLNYDIQFQNLGNAPAYNIRILDSLSNKLDMESFEFLYSSHDMIYTLRNNILSIKFNNIMLPDSSSDPYGSIGFFRFRIKPKTSTISGDSISNKALIYFDFNEPVITNYATTKFQYSNFQQFNFIDGISVYPNPTSENLELLFTTYKDHRIQIEILNIHGQTILKKNEFFKLGKQNYFLNTRSLAPGFYTIKFSDANSTGHIKFLKIH